jgi:uncharacterized membrane protein
LLSGSRGGRVTGSDEGDQVTGWQGDFENGSPATLRPRHPYTTSEASTYSATPPPSAVPCVLTVPALGTLGIAALLIGRGPLAQTVGALLVIAALSGPPLVAAWSLTTRAATPSLSWANPFITLIIPVAALIAVASVVTGRAVFGLLFALGSAAAVGWLRLDRRNHRFVCLLAAAAFFTAAGTEIIVVADDLIGTAAYRMNTVFKFYNQVWVLLSLVSAALVAVMIYEGRRMAGWQGGRENVIPATPRPRDPATLVARVAAALALLVLLAALTYPVLATGPRLEQRFTPGTPVGSLDAFAWMESGTVPVVGSPAYDEIAYAGDADAIAWFFANVSGSPVIAEASIGPYRCNGSRISAATGLPTIIGWERHEQQQRYPDTLPARVEDVRTLYTSPDPDEKEAILRRYNVEYVVVGDLERVYPIADNDCTPSGSQAGIEAFDAMVGTTLEVAHTSRGTTIYRVLPVRPV